MRGSASLLKVEGKFFNLGATAGFSPLIRKRMAASMVLVKIVTPGRTGNFIA